MTSKTVDCPRHYVNGLNAWLTGYPLKWPRGLADHSGISWGQFYPDRSTRKECFALGAGCASQGRGVGNYPSIHRSADPAPAGSAQRVSTPRCGVGATTHANRSAHSLNPVLSQPPR
jgi:hypothetical protein